MKIALGLRAAILSLALLAAVLLIWQFASVARPRRR